MPKPNSYTLADIHAVTGGTLQGDPARKIRGCAPFPIAGPDQLSLYDDAAYSSYIASSQAGAIIVKAGLEGSFTKRDIIVHANPHQVLPELLALFVPPPEEAVRSAKADIAFSARLGEGCRVEAFAVIKDGAQVGADCVVSSFCYIDRDVRIGNHCILYPGVVLRRGTVLGDRVTIHANSEIGSDGYGYYSDQKGHHKIPQLGGVTIGDDVEIGSSVTIDRGTLGNTTIGPGTKIDNLVQVAHNVIVGANCLLVSQVGISGSTRVGDNVVLGGQAGVAGHITIPSNTRIGGKSGVNATVKKPGDYSGHPLVPISRFLKNMSVLKRVRDLYEDVRAIKRKLGMR